MPLYEYACDSCGSHTEVMQRVGAPPLAACPQCGGPVQKVLAPPALQFKGSGWYITDYARRGNGANGGSKAGSEAPKATEAKGAGPESKAS